MKFIAYYTQDTPYQSEWEGLRDSLECFGLDYVVFPCKSRGSWQANTQMKAEIVRDFLKQSPGEPFVYLDVDAKVISKPVLLFDLYCDIAAAKHNGTELLSGTVYFGGTAKCVEIVDLWIELCRQYPDRLPANFLHFPEGDFAWDQRLLQMAVHRTPDVKFVELPIEYTFIQNLSEVHYPNVKPIILHTAASRRYRDTIQ